MEATADQLESRKQVTAFIEKMSAPLKKAKETIRSAWYGRSDDELKGWIERGRAIHEIEDSMGYQLIMKALDSEVKWAQAEFEVCKTQDIDPLRYYLKALRFVREFILTTTRNADASQAVLAGRPRAIAIDSTTFVGNATTQR